MNQNRKKPRIYAATMTIALAAGVTAGVSNYRAGTQFQPSGSSNEIRENRVSFSDEESRKNQIPGEKQDNSALWEKDESAQEKNALDEARDSAFLFEQLQNQLGQGQNTMNIAQQNETQIPDAGTNNKPSKANEKEPVYEITDQKDKADTVIRDTGNGTSDNSKPSQNGGENVTPQPDTGDTSGQENGDTTGTGDNTSEDGNSASGNGDNGQGTSGGDKSDSSGDSGKTDKDDEDNSKDNTDQPSKPTTPASTAKDPEITQKPKPNTGIMSDRQDSYQEDKVTNETVKKQIVIQAGTSEEGRLYKGQSVDAKMLYYALDTYVLDYSTPGNFVAYLWGEQDYGQYIQITGVSFDGGETWMSDFPVTIPEDIEDNSMFIRVQYRLSLKDKWTEAEPVSYAPMATRLFLLSEKLQNENQEIDSSWILNWDQYPESGSTLKLLSYIGKFFDWSGAPLDALLPGWTEDGENVPWTYQVTAGRHILEPADLIPLDPMYVVTLKYQWFNEEGRIDPDGYELYYLQTLTGLNIESFTEYGEKYLEKLEVPKYIQAVCLQEGVETETIHIPDTVLYIQNDGYGLRVNQSYEVDEQNPNYASEDGMLLNKEKTEIIGIPYEKKEMTISSNITKVNLTSDNQIDTLIFEADDLSEIPDMDLGNLSGCKVIVPDEMLDPFLEQYGEVLTDSGSCVAASSDQETTYICQNGIVTDNQRMLYRVLGYSGTAMRIPSNVTSIGDGAFQKAENIRTLIWPADGQITLCADSFTGSGVTKIICGSQEQFDDLAMQMKELGITDVTLHTSGKSEDGFSYYSDTMENDDGELIQVLSVTEAPEDVTEFRGVIQIDGKAVIVDQVEANAFSGCTQLKWVILPEATDYIGYQAFRGCTSLEGVLIDTREQVTIGDQAFEDCVSLRFIASNAKQAQMQGDYDPYIYNRESYDGFTRISYFFVPQDAEGYGYYANHLSEQKGVDHYEICETGAEGRVLYGVSAEGEKWLALRSGSTLDDQTTLPETTSRIYSYAFAGSTGSEFQINWSGLPLTQVQEGAFYASEVAGDVVLGTEEEESSLILEDYAFSVCSQMRSISIPSELIYLGQMVFAGDGGLRCAEFDRASMSASCYANLFQGCDQLETITMKMENPMPLVIYGTMRFQFNSNWSPEEEKEHLRLIVPENAKENYIMDWRYALSGSVAAYSGCYYLDLWNSVQSDLLDWDTMYFPADEEVDVAAKERLLEAENRIRKMVGADEVSEPTELYQFRLVGNNLTLVSVPSYRSEISLDPVTVDLPEGWYLDDIGAGAFTGAKNLTKVTIPADMVNMWSGALEGAAAESSRVTLEFQGESPLTLRGYDAQDSPFIFGIEENKIHIQVPDGTEADYIRAWTYPLAGYQDEAAMEAAIREEVAGKLNDGDDGQELADTEDSADADLEQSEERETQIDQEVQEQMVELLLPAENRLRRMMGMDEAKDGQDLISYDYVELIQEERTEETEETEEAEESEEPETETETETSGLEDGTSQDGASESEASSGAEESGQETDDSQTETDGSEAGAETEMPVSEKEPAESEASSGSAADADGQIGTDKNTETTEASEKVEKNGQGETATQSRKDAEIRQETVFTLVLPGFQKERKE